MRPLLVALALVGCKAEPLPALDRTAPALHDAATVHFDALGVAHIRAESEYDAFFLQGYTTARLRMGQMELLRRRAHGTRAEVLGEDYFLDDWQMRALGFTQLGADNWEDLQEYAPKASRTFRAYADGVYFHDYGGGPCHHGFSFAHSRADIDRILQVMDDAFGAIAASFGTTPG